MSDAAKTSRDWLVSAMSAHEAPLLRYAMRITGDADLARDVTQDVFLRLCDQDPATLNGRLRPWLYTVCRNRALELQRNRKRWFARHRERQPLSHTLDNLELSICPSIAASNGLAESRGLIATSTTNASAADMAEQRESVAEILRELSRLSANQQEAIRLRFEHGLPYKEIAAVMGTTVSNVGVMIHTAIKKLREKLAHED